MDGAAQTCGLGSKVVRPGVPHSPPSLTAQLSARSSDGSIELKLVTQPEEQHRARYQTEGSRGAVKDRPGTGHPTVKVRLAVVSSCSSCLLFIIEEAAEGQKIKTKEGPLNSAPKKRKKNKNKRNKHP